MSDAMAMDSNARAADDRRLLDRELLRSVDRLETTLEQMRLTQERQVAVAIALQEHKTIERVDSMWETMDEWRVTGRMIRASAQRLGTLSRWGCGTVIAVAALYVAAASAFHWPSPF